MTTSGNLSAISVQSWANACASVALSQNLTSGFVDQNGRPMSGYIAGETGGITIDVCFQLCGSDVMHQVGRFVTLVSVLVLMSY
jgi:hypothetical protein